MGLQVYDHIIGRINDEVCGTAKEGKSRINVHSPLERIVVEISNTQTVQKRGILVTNIQIKHLNIYKEIII